MATDPHQPEEPAEKSEEQSSRVQLWLIVLAVLALVVGLIVYSYKDWPGARYFGIADKDFWDYLKLLIVPAALAFGVYWLNRRQDEREREAEDAQQRREQYLQEERTQDEALQAYLDKMSELLIDNELHKKEGDYDETRVTARAHTLAVLERLDAKRKRTVLLFLREARLINRFEYCPPGQKRKVTYYQKRKVTYYPHYVGLGDADLSGANLEGAPLISTSGKEPISLKGANLKGATLSGAKLQGADLCEADLSDADLSVADLKPADLSGVEPKPRDVSHTNLSYTNLRGANLSAANLSGADLSGVDLTDANLRETREVTDDQLTKAKCLEGATMPNGQKYKDWLKDREKRKEDRENDPLQPEADRSKPRRWQTVFSFLRDFTRQKEEYSPFSRLLVKVLLPTYVFGIFLVWTVASIGEYSAHHPEDGAAYLPPSAYLLVAWGFGIYAGSRDGSWEHFRWFFPCVALVMALGVTFWITYVSIVDQELPIDQLWMLTLRKILVRLKVFLSTYFVFIFGALFARALARLAEEPRIDDHSRSESDSSHRFQAWLAFVGTIITALASLLGDLVT